MSLQSAFGWLMPTAVIAVVWLAGAVVAIATWKRHPTASYLTLLACLALLVAGVVGNSLQFWLITQRGLWSMQQFDLMMQMIGWGRAGLSVMGYILLLCAVFSGRGRPYQPPAVDVSIRPPREPAPADLPPRDSDDIQKPQPWS
jgi:hypothetical protein